MQLLRRLLFCLLAPVLVVGKCPGLSVGTHPGGSDIVKDGTAQGSWTGLSPMTTTGSDVFVSEFYFSWAGGNKKPLPVTVTLSHTDPDPDKAVIKPVASGSLVRQGARLGNGSQILSVNYNCLNRGGRAVLWVTTTIPRKQARDLCGEAVTDDLQLFFYWNKFCSNDLAFCSRLQLGTEDGSDDVATGGKATREWAFDAHDAVVMAGEEETQFYVSTSDGKGQRFGTPKLLGFDERLMEPKLSGAGAHGGTAAAAAVPYVVEYGCRASAGYGQSLITMVLDLCNSSIAANECDGEHRWQYEPVVVQWVKNCGRDPGDGGWLGSLLLALLAMCCLGCLAACTFKFHFLEARGLDILPGIDFLRAAIDSASRAGGSGGRYMRTPGVEFEGLQAEGGGSGGGGGGQQRYSSLYEPEGEESDDGSDEDELAGRHAAAAVGGYGSLSSSRAPAAAAAIASSLYADDLDSSDDEAVVVAALPPPRAAPTASSSVETTALSMSVDSALAELDAEMEAMGPLDIPDDLEAVLADDSDGEEVHV